MADKRAFAKFDVGYLDNPKTADLLDEHPTAVLMHMAGILYCAQHLTDGLIAPGAMQRKLGGGKVETEALFKAGLWHAPGHDCPACPEVPEGKAYVHDFLEHNRSATEAKRVAEKAAGAANARWKKGDAPSMRQASPEHQAGHSPSNASGMPREREREREEAKASSSEIPRPDVDSVIQGFSQLLDANDVKHAPGQSWYTAARLLIDKDGYTPEQIMFVAQFATTDDFWKSNVLSIPKLREKFEALKIKAQTQGKSGSSKQTTSDKMRNTMAQAQALQSRMNQQDPNQLQIGA